MKRILFVFLTFMTLATFTAEAQLFELATGWRARNATEVTESGTELSSRFLPDENWLNAVVPGTVLTTLVANGIHPDPLFGMNNTLIPDISEAGSDYYTWWFVNSFPIAEVAEESQVWIEFRGVNYSSNIYFNGTRLNEEPHSGMFLRQRFNVTPHIRAGATNHLAVLVYPPDPPGVPNSGDAGDGVIAKNITIQQSAGWSWITHAADRNSGIWDKVFVEITGPVDIVNPHITTRVPGTRTPGVVQSRAFVTISTELHNASSEEVRGELEARIVGGRRKKRVTLAPGETKSVTLRQIRMREPRLWWPNGMGNPNLYQADITFITGKDLISSRKLINFGVREVATRVDEKTGGMIISVNGRDVFVRGANWTGSDLLLRHSAERYESEVKMHAAMNLNMIRVKGGTITERPEFYDACDRYGIMVWQDLWITGDGNGRWPDPKKRDNQEVRRGYPSDHQLFIRSVEDQVLMLRNHPSLMIWGGGDQFPPPADIDRYLRETLFPGLDPERVYISSSVSGDGAGEATMGTMGVGPHRIADRASLFTGTSFPFNTGIGSVGLPVRESLEQFLSADALITPDEYNLHPEWEYHKYLPYGSYPEQYGAVSDFDDFVMKAQIVNYEQYRALQESFNAGMWSSYTGSLIWKSQNGWSSLGRQLYDYFLVPNAGFYGLMNGARPFHVQMNLNDSVMTVVNSSARTRSDINAGYRIYDISGRLVSSFDTLMSFPAGEVTPIRKIELPSERSDVMFLELTIESRAAAVIHDLNSYRIAPRSGDYSSLEKLGEATLSVEIYRVSENRLQLELHNNGGVPAFFTRFRLLEGESGRSLNPVFFEDNYVTVMPGRRRYLQVDISSLPRSSRSVPLVLEMEGFNLRRRALEF